MGLSSGACLSSLGHSVVCLDIDAAKIAMLREGRIPIVEIGLAELVTTGLANKTLSFTTEISKSIPHADVVFLCLPTPQDDDGSADLSYVEKVSSLSLILLIFRRILKNFQMFLQLVMD